MEVADLPGKKTKKTRLILFREQGCMGATQSLEATCREQVGSSFL